MTINNDNKYIGFINKEVSNIDVKDDVYYLYQTNIFFEYVQDYGIVSLFSNIFDLCLEEVKRGFEIASNIECINLINNAININNVFEENDVVFNTGSTLYADFKIIDENILQHRNEFDEFLKFFFDFL